MIQTQTKLKVADNSGAKELKVIAIKSIVKGSGYQKFGKVGDIVSVSVQKALPHSDVSQHDKMFAVIVRTAKEYKRKDGTYIRFDDNAAVLIDLKDRSPLGSRIFGPVARELKAKGYNKIISLAPEVL